MKTHFLLFIILTFFFTGCTSVHLVEHSEESYIELSHKIHGKSASIVLADAQKSTGKIKFINFDSTSWVESTLQTDQTHPTVEVKEIAVLNRGKGAFQGFAAGFLIGALAGSFIGEAAAEGSEYVGVGTLTGMISGGFIGGLLGLGIGAGAGGIDKYTLATFRPDKRSLLLEELSTYKPGTNVRIFLIDGTLLHGKFLGVEPLPEEEYAEKYTRCREKLSEEYLLPEIGDTITITTIHNPEKPVDCEFLGFDGGKMEIKGIGFTKAELISLNEIQTIRNRQGEEMDPEILNRLMIESKIPFLSAVSLQIEQGNIMVPTDTIKKIE
jgi:hypothetical protein